MYVSRFTEQMRALLPQWMKMAKDEGSVGTRFLNVFGMEFEDVQRYLDELFSNQYIETADIGQIDIAYKIPLALPVVTDLVNIDTVSGFYQNTKYNFILVDTIQKFYMAEEDESVAILDRQEGVIYIRPSVVLINQSLYKPFDYVSINGTAHYEYALHHIWNAFDEFGLLLGVERLYGERNVAFKERILDVFRKPGNSTKSGLSNAISRELGLTTEEVKLNEFADKAFRGSLLNSDGTPSKKLVNYIDRMNKVLGFTWDNMTWGEAYWRSVEESQMGLEYLPHVWDVNTDKWKDEDFQSGIGDGNDLLVKAPKKESNIRKFKYNVGLRGRESRLQSLHPELSFKYKVTAKGKILSQKYLPEKYKYTVLGAEIIKLNYIVRAMKNYIYTTNMDFDPAKPGMTYDDAVNPNLEIVTGNTVMSNPSHQYLRVEMDLATRSPQQSPSVDKVLVNWRDSGGVLNTLTLDTQTELTQNNATVDTNMNDIDVPTTGAIELGYGDFYHKIDTEGSWREGSGTNIDYISTGSIQLRLPQGG